MKRFKNWKEEKHLDIWENERNCQTEKIQTRIIKKNTSIINNADSF